VYKEEICLACKGIKNIIGYYNKRGTQKIHFREKKGMKTRVAAKYQ
jgi:hypothetical protein